MTIPHRLPNSIRPSDSLHYMADVGFMISDSTLLHLGASHVHLFLRQQEGLTLRLRHEIIATKIVAGSCLHIARKRGII
jgi:hypothetical protein